MNNGTKIANDYSSKKRPATVLEKSVLKENNGKQMKMLS